MKKNILDTPRVECSSKSYTCSYTKYSCHRYHTKHITLCKPSEL